MASVTSVAEFSSPLHDADRAHSGDLLRDAGSVHHVDNPAGAAGVAATLASALPGCRPAIVTGLGPVLGVHLGPGAVGVVLVVESMES